MRTDNKELFGLGFVIFAFLGGFALLFWVLGLVGSQDVSVLSGARTNRAAAPSGNDEHNQTAKCDYQTGGGVNQLTVEIFGVNDKARISGDSLNKKMVAKTNGNNPTNRMQNLECVNQDQSEIRICLIIHITNDVAMTPNDPKLSHGANNRKREFASKRKMKEQSPLAPARC
jgi:hypothetical protein